MQTKRKDNFIISVATSLFALVLVASCSGNGNAVGGDGSSAGVPKYSRTFSTQLPFGHRIQIPYLFAPQDADGDGASDFAAGAKVQPVNNEDLLDNPYIRTFVVQNRSSTGDLRAYDLGQNGLTHRTWAGGFYRPGGRGPMHFVLGRNGEMGLPGDLRGERTSIFRIEPGSDGWSVRTAFVSSANTTTSSIGICDIDGDGIEEIHANNVASAFSRGVPPWNRTRMYQYAGGSFRVVDPRRYLAGMQTGDVSTHNFTKFEDIDGDGDCDFLAAYEGIIGIEPDGPLVGAMGAGFSASDIAKFQSYVNINNNGSFRGTRRLLPNPPFGRTTSSFGIGGTRMANGEIIVALTSSYFPAHTVGFSKFALQLFAWRDGRFVEVTNEKLVGTVKNDEANQSYIEFADIDGDGDQDFYLTLYQGAPVTIFLQEGDRFVARRIPVGGSSFHKAVAFLKAPGKSCMDVAVLDEKARLQRYSCR